MTVRCPKCLGEDLRVFMTSDAVRMETILRAQFVFDRVEKAPQAEERKDLTSFAHGAPAQILECPRCRILIRHEQETHPVRTYVEDEYDRGVMDRLLPRYVAAYRDREKPYRSLLSAGARVLEIGPHMGAFMEVAAAWGWDPVGLDIGKDTTRFVRSRGFTVHEVPLEEAGFPASSFDAIFVWNCFEQIPDPRSLLQACKRVVKPDGILVIRTPNGLFYQVAQRRLRETPDTDLALWIGRALGYNNLLAFPYLYGYGSQAITELAGEHGFTPGAGLNSEIITLPFPQLEEWVAEEHRAALALVRGWSELAEFENRGILTGPWMELIFRSGAS